MNVLFLAHRIPYPPNKGEKIRAYHQIRHIAKRHTVHLACLIDDPEDRQHVAALEQICASVDSVYRGKLHARVKGLAGLLSSKPLSIHSFYSKELAQKIADRMQSVKIDVVFVFSSAMAEYVLRMAEVPRVVDLVDVDSQKYRLYAECHSFPLSWLYRLEARRLGAYEDTIVGLFDRSVVVSEAEASLLRPRVRNREISVISNGVDLESFAPNFDEEAAPKQPNLVFTGVMDYFPNVDAVTWFCREVFPRIREIVPEASFTIVGRNPARQVRELASDPHVRVTGFVDDVCPYLQNASIAVAPLRIARGLQNKVLEAMSCGLPVVGTSQAFEGTAATPADGIRVADDAELFAREVVAFLADPGQRRESSRDARDYAERCHEWQAHCAQLETLLHDAIKQRDAGAVPVEH